MSDSNRKIQIVGGGLAGLSLGIALQRRGVPATVWEAAQYPRHRVCGEFISGVSRETLESIGIADLFDDAPKLQSTTWWLANRHLFDAALPEPAIGLSRFSLDLRLADRFRELGGELRTGERFGTDDPIQPGLVWATGRERAKSDLLGLKLHAEGFELQADLEMHFASGGYVGLCAIENGKVNVSALFHRNNAVKAERSELLLAYLESCGMTDLVERIRRSEIDPESHAAVMSVPVGGCRSAAAEEPCAIGDFFGTMGPFTGNGMSLAFESAALAAEPLSDFAKSQSTWIDAKTSALTILRSRFRRRLKSSKALHRLLLHPFGLRGVSLLGSLGILPFQSLYRLVR